MESTTAGPSDDPGLDPARRAVSETLDQTALKSTMTGSTAGGPIPERIGRYLVMEVLDEGGQGMVLRVVHPELGKDYVLKLARLPVGVDPARREQALREGRLLAQCEHPNLVRVIDVDVHEGRPYMVMDYVAGPTLQQAAELDRPRPRQAARLVAELARAVEYIHSRGIVHQDIKPRNIVIDGLGRPRLIDFGLARLRHAWSDDSAGLIGGTPGYMSPEQARCQDAQIGPWTDIFGLGGVFYFLLTGQPLYQDQPQSSAWSQASQGAFVPPRRINPRSPRALERICLKALAADPRRRFRSAAELDRALHRFLWRPWLVAAGLLILGFILLSLRARGPLPTATPADVVPPVAARPDTALRPEVAPAPRIVSFEIKHYRGIDAPEDLGTIGVTSREATCEDSVRAIARLDRPAYCYLIALNPDGGVQLCEPAEPTAAPSPRAEIHFPADAGSGFSLTDGAGIQAFVLLAANRPLPPFGQWTQAGSLRWRSVPAEGVWQFDGHQISRLGGVQRGEIKRLFDSPRPFAQLCAELQNLDGIDAVQAIAFPVKPKVQ
jgi:predicted Ser/Thr protein kinase